MTTGPRPRAVLYVRLSVTDDDSTSLARQEADLRARADRDGWDVTAVVPDDGVSGGARRANADRALAMLRDGTADVLAVWKFDRWSRQGIGAVADLIAVLDAKPGTLFVADRDGLTSDQPAWRIIASVLAEVARMERDNTSARVTSSIATLRATGRYSGGTVPYGYRPADNPTGPGRVLVIDDAEAAVVRDAAARVLAGASVYSVAVDLNRRDVPTRTRTTAMRAAADRAARGLPDDPRLARQLTTRWSVQALTQVLAADTIVGRVRAPGRNVPTGDTTPDGRPRTRRVPGDLVRDADGLPVSVWPAVLTPDTWSRVRAVLNVDRPRDERPPQRRRAAQLLSGIAKCAACGTPLYAKTAGTGASAYACPSVSRGRGDRCPGVSVSVDLLDDYVVGRYLASHGDRPMYERRESVGPDADTADVDRAIADTTAAMVDAVDDDMPALLTRLSTLKARRDDLRTRPAQRMVTLVPTGHTHREAWDAAADDLTTRRQMIRTAYASVRVRKGTRGRRGFDASRVRLMASPPFPAGADDAANYVPGTVVLPVDLDDYLDD